MSKPQQDREKMYKLKWKRGVIDCSVLRSEEDIDKRNIRGPDYKSIVEANGRRSICEYVFNDQQTGTLIVTKRTREYLGIPETSNMLIPCRYTNLNDKTSFKATNVIAVVQWGDSNEIDRNIDLTSKWRKGKIFVGRRFSKSGRVVDFDIVGSDENVDPRNFFSNIWNPRIQYKHIFNVEETNDDLISSIGLGDAFPRIVEICKPMFQETNTYHRETITIDIRKTLKAIDDVFDECIRNQPAVLFIDGFELLATVKPSNNFSKNEKTLFSRAKERIMECMEKLQNDPKVFVIASVIDTCSVDPELKKIGMFEKDVFISLSDENNRKEMIDYCLKKYEKKENYDLLSDFLVKETNGYSFSDILNLIYKAGTQGRSVTSIINRYKEALKQVSPFGLKNVIASRPKGVETSFMAGYENIRTRMSSSIQNAVENEEIYMRFSIPSSRGYLMHGPPGCGKTLIAKTIANSANINFISVKGPELVSKGFGDSEQNIRNVFEKARAAAPCILFFDEIDSVAAKRGSGGNESGLLDTMVNQLLTELDGVTETDRLIFIGATNRLDSIDEAIRRPGRIDEEIFVDLPDVEGKIEIFNRKMRGTITMFTNMYENYAPNEQSGIFETYNEYGFLVDYLQNQYSGADIDSIFGMAIQNWILVNEEKRNDQSFKSLLEEAFQEKKPSAATYD